MSAVLTTRNLVPASVALPSHCSGVAPQATHPLRTELPFASEARLTSDGEISFGEREQSIGDFYWTAGGVT